MTHDFSKAKVGDTVTGRFEGKVARTYLDDLVPYIVTESNWYITDNADGFIDVEFNSPKLPLPTTAGSVIKSNGVHFMFSNDRRWIGQSGAIYSYFDTSDTYTIIYDAGKGVSDGS